MVIMGETVKTGVIKALKAKYPNVPIYKEKVVQNMAVPCFFVMQLPVRSRSRMNTRKEKTHSIHVRYHPEKFSYEEMDQAGTELLDLLSEIILDDGLPVYGNELSYEISAEGYLMALADYKINTIKLAADGPKMTNLNEQLYIKEK